MNKKEFKIWLGKVDQILRGTCGLDSSDLPDQCYTDMFEDGIDPKIVAEEVLFNVCEDFGIDPSEVLI